MWHALSAQVDRSAKAYDGDVAGSYGPLVKESYGDIDLFVGEVVERLGAKDRLILLSGNGFHSWQSEVHLDAWLRDEGYLVLAKDAPAAAQIAGRPASGLAGRVSAARSGLDARRLRAVAGDACAA